MFTFDGSIMRRGPKTNSQNYYQPPSEWFRIGLKVDVKFNEDIDKWLAMNQNDDEWWVAYHGVRHC
jgi:hypothetical protein